MANTKTASLVTITDLTDAPIGILSNESFVLAADLNGVVGSFSGASTTLSIKLGGVDDSANWSVSAGTPVGITGSLVGKTYTVTAMSSDIGYVDLTASMAGFSNIVKRFSVAKAKQGAKGDTGATGATGAQGKGISSTSVTYQAGASGTSYPTGAWSGTIPSVADNQFLWTKTVINYTDSSSTTAYSVGKMGAQGPQGNTGATGAAGVGISSTVVTYQAGASGPTEPTGTWSATVPTVADNQFLWTKVVINYTSGSPTTSYSVGKMGAQGPQGAKGNTGDQGPQGIPAERYNVVPSVNTIIRKLLSPYISPTSMTFKVYKTTGNGSPVLVTSGVTNTIAYSTDGIIFTNVDSSIQPTSSGTTTLTLNNATYNFARGSSVSGYKDAVCVRCISTIGGVEVGRITIGFSLDDALLEIAKIDGSVVKIDGSKIYANSIIANEAIVEGSINAGNLNAANIFVENANIQELIAENLNTEKFFARVGVINKLTLDYVQPLNDAITIKLDEQSIFTGPVAPPYPPMDKMWIDTSTDPEQMKRWTGTEWAVVSKSKTDGYISMGTIKMPGGGTEFGVAVGEGVDTLDVDGEIPTAERSMSVQTAKAYMILTGGEQVFDVDATGADAKSFRGESVVIDGAWIQTTTPTNGFVLKWGG